jgi:hypothetical protein
VTARLWAQFYSRIASRSTSAQGCLSGSIHLGLPGTVFPAAAATAIAPLVARTSDEMFDSIHKSCFEAWPVKNGDPSIRIPDQARPLEDSSSDSDAGAMNA